MYFQRSVIIEAVSLIELMASDSKIKRYIHDIKYFQGAPTMMKMCEFGGVEFGGGSSMPPICFVSLALLLFKPMAMVLVVRKCCFFFLNLYL